MLGRLFKYDMKSTSSILAPVSALALLVAMLATVSLKVLVKLGDNPKAAALNVTMTTIFVLSILSIIVYAVVCWVVQLYRFYKGLYTDEGYLTFTLPVKCWQILLSKLLCAVLWMIISFAVIALCAAVIILFGSGDGVVNLDWVPSLQDALNALKSLKVSYIRMIITAVLSLLISTVCGFSVFFLSITVGAIISKKHKVLAGIGTYYGINLILSTINSLLSVLVGGSTANKVVEDNPALDTASGAFGILFSAIDEANILGLIVNTTVAVLAFFICNYLMKNKLNLA